MCPSSTHVMLIRSCKLRYKVSRTAVRILDLHAELTRNDPQGYLGYSMSRILLKLSSRCTVANYNCTVSNWH
jgi:hypothetical protein